MLRAQTTDAVEFETGEIDFVFVLLKSSDIDQFSSNLADLLDTAVDQNGTVMQVLSSLSLIVYNLPVFPEEHPHELRLSLVETLKIRFPDQVKIVHGSATASVGNIGSERRMTYSAVFSDLGAVIDKLAAIGYGEDAEVEI